MEDTARQEGRGWLVLVGIAALWCVSYLVARAVLDTEGLPAAARVGIALAPVPFFGVFLWLVIRGIADQDELERRIHLEALAVAFPSAILLLMTLGLLELAIELNREDWSYRHAWAYLPLFYFVGLVRAKRKYQ